MVNIEWIRKTFAPPIVATLIAISLVTGWSPQATPGSAVTPDPLAVTVSR
ncbi:MAG: hypothetical protein U9P00_12820 [Pseudomonadota bacterium]|nr:hypothetical protein [Pseudomonadota bacterium]